MRIVSGLLLQRWRTRIGGFPVQPRHRLPRLWISPDGVASGPRGHVLPMRKHMHSSIQQLRRWRTRLVSIVVRPRHRLCLMWPTPGCDGATISIFAAFPPIFAAFPPAEATFPTVAAVRTVPAVPAAIAAIAAHDSWPLHGDVRPGGHGLALRRLLRRRRPRRRVRIGFLPLRLRLHGLRPARAA
jgi:hypothetical protein